MELRTTGMVAALALALAACATAPSADRAAGPVRIGQVGVEDLSAAVAASARMELGDDEHFLPPLPEPDNPLPAYPAELLAQRLPPQAVCLRVSISEAGWVVLSAPLQLPPDCELQGVPVQFVAAAQAAVAGWRFDPALRCVFKPGERPEHRTCVGAQEIPQAVSLTYRFVFEQQDGRGAVRIPQ